MICHFEGPVATLAFDRPKSRNALGRATWLALPVHIAEAAARVETRAIVLRGAGGHFAAGADIAEFDTVFAGRAATLDYLAQMSAATAAIEAVDLPVIAVIEGMCIGAAVAVALACDVRFAARTATFAVTPAKLGLMYSLADTRRLTAAVGRSAAKDLLFTGRMIDAGRAAAIGLIDEAFAADVFDAAVAERLAMIAATSAWSHARSKAVVRLIAEGAAHETEATRDWFADAPNGPDYREGLAAFRAKRPPAFPSR